MRVVRVDESDLIENVISDLEEAFDYYDNVFLEEEMMEILMKFLRENYVFTGLNAGTLVLDETGQVKTLFPPKYEGKEYSEVPSCVYLVDMIALLLKKSPGFIEIIKNRYLELQNENAT